MLIVKKFGGTSVGSPERIMNVAIRCVEDYKKGNDVVVVLSAMGKTTDDLISLAHKVNPKPPKRELDMLLVTGEQVSVSMMAMAMASLGVRAVSLNAFQVAMHTTSQYSNARLKRIDCDRIRHELEDRKIVIVTGFQGVRNARKLQEITYDEMLEMASLGAGVLHNRSVEMAKKYGVTLVVRSSLNYSEGTVVKEDAKVERMLISGVAVDKNADRVSVIGLKDQPGVAFRLFDILAKANVNVDMILQSIGRDDTKDISFTCDDGQMDEAIKAIESNRERLKYHKIDMNSDVAKVSIVGAGMMTNPGVAAKMFEALYNEGININMISTSEIRVTVLISEREAERAANAIHDAFGLAD